MPTSPFTKTFNNIINFRQLTSFTSLNALSKLSLIAKLLFSMSPRKFLRERKLLSMKNVDKAFRASTISYQITSDCARLSQFSYPKETDLGVKMLLPYHCPVWFLRSCLISSITGYLIGIRSLPPSWKYPTWLSSTRPQGLPRTPEQPWVLGTPGALQRFSALLYSPHILGNQFLKIFAALKRCTKSAIKYLAFVVDSGNAATIFYALPNDVLTC